MVFKRPVIDTLNKELPYVIDAVYTMTEFYDIFKSISQMNSVTLQGQRNLNFTGILSKLWSGLQIKISLFDCTSQTWYRDHSSVNILDFGTATFDFINETIQFKMHSFTHGEYATPHYNRNATNIIVYIGLGPIDTSMIPPNCPPPAGGQRYTRLRKTSIRIRKSRKTRARKSRKTRSRR